MMFAKKITALAISVGFTTIAHAQQPGSDDQGFYIAASLGNASYDAADLSSAADVLTAEFEAEFPGSNLSSLTDESDSGYKISAGYKLSQFFAVELAYLDLGSTSFGTEGVIPIDGIGVETTADGISETDGLALSAIGILPVTEKFDLFAKLGYFDWKSSVSYSLSMSAQGISESDSESLGSVSDGDVFYGIGAIYNLGKFDIRAEYELYSLDDTDVDLFSIGAAYHF